MKRALAVFTVASIGLWGAAVPAWAGDDDDRHRSDKENSQNRSGNDDCRDAENRCSDDDLSPVVKICLLTFSCAGEDGPRRDGDGGHGKRKGDRSERDGGGEDKDDKKDRKNDKTNDDNEKDEDFGEGEEYG